MSTTNVRTARWSLPLVGVAVLALAAVLIPVAANAADTGYKSPTANVSNNADDGDDWSDPQKAYSDGSGFAYEENNERHRYYNFGFSIPAGSTIDGIIVKTDAWTPDDDDCKLGVDLSWNGGTSWTSEQSVYLDGSEDDYAFGSQSDKWGHTWTLSELANGNFRLRVHAIDPGSSCNNNTDTKLDWVRAKVFYTQAICGDGQVNQSSEQCDGQDYCTDQCTWEPAHINVTKVVCDDESKLPNWGDGGANITSSTAADYIASHEGCVTGDWSFQWAPDGTANPGDNSGIVGGAWSAPFGGIAEVTAPVSRVWVREVAHPDYVPFSGDTGAPWDEYSAEFYCSTDVLNYDNYDYITDLQPGQNYYCVGFNALPAPTTGSLTICKYNKQEDSLQWNMTVVDQDGEDADETWNTATNGETGCVTLEDMDFGSYLVSEEQVNGWKQLYPNDDGTWGDILVNINGDNLNPEVYFVNEEIPTYSLHGYKWNDLNGNGLRDCTAPSFSVSMVNDLIQSPVRDCEPLLSGWTVFIDQNDNGQLDEGEMNAVTSNDPNPQHFGWYWFEGLTLGNYKVCEVPQAGWNQTFPLNENANCHWVSVPDGEGTCWADQQPNAVQSNMTCNFGNQVIPPTCGDGVKNQESEQCDGTDGVGANQVCTTRCTLQSTEVKAPILSLVKTVDRPAISPNGILVYTITITNSGNADATNVTLTDTLPAGLTYLDAQGNNTGETTKTWTWATLAAGASQTVTFSVHVDSNATANAYKNIATVKADNYGEVTANASTKVVTPTVLGATAPALKIEKSVAESFVNPGGTATYTVVVTNTGDAPALSATLTDTLPTGFTFTETKTNTQTWNLGDLAPTESKTVSYTVKVGGDVAAGTYLNKATAQATDVDPVSATVPLQVRAVQVLGAETSLPVTGAGISAIVGLAAYAVTELFRRRKQ